MVQNSFQLFDNFFVIAALPQGSFFRFGGFGLFLCVLCAGLQRCDDRAERTTVENGLLFGCAKLCAGCNKLIHDLTSDGHVAHFTALEAHNDADLVSLRQERLCMARLRFEVVRVDTAGELYLLHLDDLLLLAGFLDLLLSVETELTVIHDSADRGNGIRSHEDEIESLFVRDTKCGVARHNAKLLVFRTDQTDLLQSDVFIDEFVVFFCANGDTPPISAAMDKIAHSVKTKKQELSNDNS